MAEKQVFTGRPNLVYRPEPAIFPLHPVEEIINEIKIERSAHMNLQGILMNPYSHISGNTRVIAINLVESQINLDHLNNAIRRKDRQIFVLQQFLQALLFRL